MTILGDEGLQGTYLLRVVVQEDIAVVFGRFGKGRPIPVPAGEYSYVGSALGSRGATALGFRLLRHASRTRGKPPHPIQGILADAFARAGLPAGGGAGEKKLRWHIDHLLDREAAELTAVIVARGPERLEAVWGRLLEEDPHTRVLVKGLGAGDAPGSTHLLRVAADERWWAGLPGKFLA